MKISGALENIDTMDEVIAFVDESIRYDVITHSGMANFGSLLNYDELISYALNDIEKIKLETAKFIKKSMGEMDK